MVKLKLQTPYDLLDLSQKYILENHFYTQTRSVAPYVVLKKKQKKIKVHPQVNKYLVGFFLSAEYEIVKIKAGVVNVA